MTSEVLKALFFCLEAFLSLTSQAFLPLSSWCLKSFITGQMKRQRKLDSIKSSWTVWKKEQSSQIRKHSKTSSKRLLLKSRTETGSKLKVQHSCWLEWLVWDAVACKTQNGRGNSNCTKKDMHEPQSMLRMILTYWKSFKHCDYTKSSCRPCYCLNKVSLLANYQIKQSWRRQRPAMTRSLKFWPLNLRTSKDLSTWIR